MIGELKLLKDKLATEAQSGLRWAIVSIGLQAILLVLALYAAYQAIGWLDNQIGTKADLWLGSVRHGGESAPTATNLVAPSGVVNEIAVRLNEQLLEIQRSAHYHLTVAKGFFRLQFIAVSVATTCAGIAGAMLIPISRAGWSNAKPWLVRSFMVFAVVAALTTTLNQVYRLGETVDANAALYYGFLQVEDEILSYYPRYVAEDTTLVTPIQLVQLVDTRVGRLRSFAIQLDAGSVPSTAAISEQINRVVTTSTSE